MMVTWRRGKGRNRLMPEPERQSLSARRGGRAPLPTAHCLLAYCPLPTCLLPTAYLPTAHYLLAYCPLPTAHCLLAYCPLPTAHCLLAYCPLPTAYCLLPTAYCLLPTAYCLLLPKEGALAASVNYHRSPSFLFLARSPPRSRRRSGEGHIASPAGVAVWSFYRHAPAKLEFGSISATPNLP